MEPLSIIGAVITVSTFIKDVIVLAREIQASVEKISKNKRRILNLINDVVHTLQDMERLYMEDADKYDRLEGFTGSLIQLKTEMEKVHCSLLKLLPKQPDKQFAIVKARYKAWSMRDEVEEEIVHLRETVLNAYTKFTAFAAARTEYALIVHSTQHRVHLRRLETLVTGYLLETKFGHTIIHDLTTKTLHHQSVERQYLHLQVVRVLDTMQNLAATRPFVLEEPDSVHNRPNFTHIYPDPEQPEQVVRRLLRLRQTLDESSDTFTTQRAARELAFVAVRLNHLGMRKETIVAHSWVSQFYRSLAPGHDLFIPHLTLSLLNLSISYDDLEKSRKASEDALISTRLLLEMHPELDYRSLLGSVLRNRGNKLAAANRHDEALVLFQEAVDTFTPLLPDFMTKFPENRLALKAMVVDSTAVSIELSLCLSKTARHKEAYESALLHLHFFSYLPGRVFVSRNLIFPARGFSVIVNCLIALHKEKALTFTLLEDVLSKYYDLAKADDTTFGPSFLHMLLIYTHICKACPVANDDEVLQLPLKLGGRTVIHDLHLAAMPLNDKIAELPERVDRFAKARGHENSFVRDLVTCYFNPEMLPLSANTATGIRPIVALFFNAHLEEAQAVMREIATKLMASANWGHIHAFLTRIMLYVQLPEFPQDTMLAISTVSQDLITHHKKHPMALEVARAYRVHSLILSLCKQDEVAVTYLDECLSFVSISVETPKVTQAEKDQVLAIALRNKASYLSKMNKLDKAIATCKEAAEIWRNRIKTNKLPSTQNLMDTLRDLTVYLRKFGDLATIPALEKEMSELRTVLVPPGLPKPIGPQLPPGVISLRGPILSAPKVLPPVDTASIVLSQNPLLRKVTAPNPLPHSPSEPAPVPSSSVTAPGNHDRSGSPASPIAAPLAAATSQVDGAGTPLSAKASNAVTDDASSTTVLTEGAAPSPAKPSSDGLPADTTTPDAEAQPRPEQAPREGIKPHIVISDEPRPLEDDSLRTPRVMSVSPVLTDEGPEASASSSTPTRSFTLPPAYSSLSPRATSPAPVLARSISDSPAFTLHLCLAIVCLIIGWIYLPIHQTFTSIASNLVILYPLYLLWEYLSRRLHTTSINNQRILTNKF